MTELVLRSERVVTPSGTRAAAIQVAGGRILAVAPPAPLPRGVPVVELGTAVVFPGLVDTHVHINEPGRTEWEGFASATRAAAAGGVTTLLDMPLNSIPATTSTAAFEAKLAAGQGQLAVDVGLIGGVVPGNLDEIAPLFDRGVFAFKCFLVPSGVPEFSAVTAADLRRALPLLASRRALLMVHAELPEPIEQAAGALQDDPRHYATWLAARPKTAETEAVRLLATLAAETGARIHIVHLSRAESVPLIEAARAAGAHLTAETCPHYLTFAAEEIPDGATEFKCAPPIGEADNREGLWQALRSGALTAVVSDHSPCPPRLKRTDTGDFLSAWGGIASLSLGLRAVWTGARARGLPFERVAEWMSAGPARLAGLIGRKGAIAPGYDADLVVWDPEAESVVDPAELFHRHPLTPYAGRRLAGAILSTYLRGVEVYRREGGQTPRLGRFLNARAA